MGEFLNLVFILIWGMLLGLFYCLVDGVVVRRKILTYVLWPLGGVVFFFATASFLFWLDKGAVGMYGFPVMAFGFFVYLHFFHSVVVRAFAPVVRVMYHGLRLIFRVFVGMFFAVLLPLGWFAQGAGVFISFVFKILRKLVPKRETISQEEMGSEVSSL